jgi:hypothetical protein
LREPQFGCYRSFACLAAHVGEPQFVQSKWWAVRKCQEVGVGVPLPVNGIRESSEVEQKHSK